MLNKGNKSPREMVKRRQKAKHIDFVAWRQDSEEDTTLRNMEGPWLSGKGNSQPRSSE